MTVLLVLCHAMYSHISLVFYNVEERCATL